MCTVWPPSNGISSAGGAVGPHPGAVCAMGTLYVGLTAEGK